MNPNINKDVIVSRTIKVSSKVTTYVSKQISETVNKSNVTIDDNNNKNTSY